MITESLKAYLDLIKKWNKTYNLTTIKNNAAWQLHIEDSLSINDYLQGDHILDVGSGAGLPGIPLAIANPNKQFTLVDASQKRCCFLTQVKIELGLNNVIVKHARVENCQGEFTTITSRAFSSLKTFYDFCHHLLAEDGVMLAMKGRYPEAELEALNKPYDVIKLSVFQDYERHLIKLS